MRILLVTAEVAPWSRTGGLGEVCGALADALAARGHRVVTLSPRYALGTEPPARDAGEGYEVWLDGGMHGVRWRVLGGDGGPWHVFVEHPALARPGIYGGPGGPWPDNAFRFALLSRVALELPRRVPLWDGRPAGEEIVVHAHDWHAALVPVYAEALYRPLSHYARARTVLTLHNAAYQGDRPLEAFDGLDLAPRHRGTLEHGGRLNPLKGGIVAADRVTTVSPGHAAELCTPGGGFGLHHLLARRADEGAFAGILNGLDTRAWDPATDPHLAARFSADAPGGKAACTRALRAELGLPDRPVPLLACVSRLVHQKGIDLLLAVADEVVGWDVQLVVLGTGEPALEEGLRRLEARHPDRVRALLAFDVPLSHRVFAGADLVVVPSRFEPCGLTQMIGMRYGAVPVVRATGGLRDTVEPWSPDRGEGTGWLFHDLDPAALRDALGHAVRTWRDHPDAFARLRANGMRRDWSWDRAARRYEEEVYGA